MPLAGMDGSHVCDAGSHAGDACDLEHDQDHDLENRGHHVHGKRKALLPVEEAQNFAVVRDFGRQGHMRTMMAAVGRTVAVDIEHSLCSEGFEEHSAAVWADSRTVAAEGTVAANYYIEVVVNRVVGRHTAAAGHRIVVAG